VQVVTTFKCPPASHDCTALPEHRFGVPGTHSPPHWFVVESQTNVHAVAGPQWPAVSQVSTLVVVTQRVLPGLQSPVHIPLSPHTLGQGVSGWFVPAASHRTGVLPTQLRMPGWHEPVHPVIAPLPLHANAHAVGVSRQIPCKSHCWITGLDGLQRLSPAMQGDAQAPMAASQ
jgi:hypothetical protein